MNTPHLRFFTLLSLWLALSSPSLALSVAAPDGVTSSPPMVNDPNLLPLPNRQIACSFRHLIGQNVTAIDRRQFQGRPVRIYHPTDPITMDYSYERIDVIIDANNRILDVKTCL